MDKFLSCDWGTTAFRLRLVMADTLQFVAEEKSGEGIAHSHQLWKVQSGDAQQREAFFAAIIRRYIDAMAHRLQTSLDGIPVILSGMTSSSIGMTELPYKQLPLDIDGGNLEIKLIDAGPNPMLIISGACTANDVMRGEETKIIGCAEYFSAQQGHSILIMPGTHSKHAVIEGGKATSFSTYLTGEFFELLANKSILSASVSPGGDITEEANRACFREGVLVGRDGNLLHQSFMVRTNQLLLQMPPQQNYFYLSGLLIGAELAAITANTSVVLLSGQTHLPFYTLALDALGIPVAHTADADWALMNGQRILFAKYFG